MQKYLLLALLLAAPAYGQAADLRAAAGCGSPKTQFNVKVEKKGRAMPRPAPGKAIVFVISEYKTQPGYMTLGHVTTRVGLDGNWMGASHQNSYLFFTVNPGDHQLCSDVQSIFAPKSLAAAADLTAAPDQSYFYRVVVNERRGEKPRMYLDAVDNAEGALLMSNAGLSMSKAKK
ncbi:MAG TPA: hypothetical protein VHX36_01260 [Candidatus Acidoferrales bacterium]|jgi:hypothetical protein|nr:hypothetical protein [Candidatus Acidoferrales bacterium]